MSLLRAGVVTVLAGLLSLSALAGETLKTLDQAKQAAASTGKLILVDGTADW